MFSLFMSQKTLIIWLKGQNTSHIVTTNAVFPFTWNPEIHIRERQHTQHNWTGKKSIVLSLFKIKTNILTNEYIKMGFGYLGDWTQTGEEFLLTIESRSFLRQNLQLLGRSLTLCTLLSQSDNNNKETSKPPTSITQSFFMHAGFTQNFNIGLMTNLWILLSWNVLNSKFNICVFNWFFTFYGARVHILPFPPALPYPTLHSYPLCQTVPDCPICPPFHIPSCYATTIFLLASPNSLVLFNYKALTEPLSGPHATSWFNCCICRGNLRQPQEITSAPPPPASLP